MLTLDLTGKLAVITGSAGQLGRVMARTLAGCGADIALHYNTSSAKAEELAQEIRQMGRRAFCVQADVCDLSQVLAMRDAIVQNMGGAPDIVVDNAVIQYQWASVLEQPVEDYESQFRSCVLQNVHMAKAFVPAMVEKGWGRFIGINTECSIQCFPGQSAYVSGKRGMDGVLRVLAKEVGEHQVTVNQVAPGWTISDRDRMNHSEKQPTDERIPLKRRGTDQEIANVVAFLASDLASYITGSYIPVCGGNVIPGI